MLMLLQMLALAVTQAQAVPVAPSGTKPDAAPAVAPSATQPLLRDTRGRPMIHVRINGRGPFPMIVDTAAQVSLLSGDLVPELKLAPAGSIGVNGATGAGQEALFPVDRFTTELFDQRDILLPSLSNSAVTDARGIVGMEPFTRRKLLLDRTNARIGSEPSGPPASGFVALAGRITGEGFVQVPMTLDGVEVQALIDTGAGVTLMNDSAFRLLRWAADDPRIKDGGEIRGAGAGTQKVLEIRLARVGIGPARLSNVPVVVTPASPEEVPSVILGNDLLNLFTAYAVDFGRGELQIRLPQASRERTH